jgi:ribonuclease HII
VLTAALEDWQLQAYRETAARCEYLFTPRNAWLVPGEPPPRLRLVITPQAESQSFAVALASMVSKYIREIFMHHWNAYWQQQVPGLRPTAGYPGDALRFLQAIEQARLQLGLEEAVLRRYR